MTFRERYQRWKAGELVYSAGKILPEYDGGKDEYVSDPDLIRQAVEFVGKNEGYRVDKYYDPIGKVWTNGYGFTSPADVNRTWTREEADARLGQMLSTYDKVLSDSVIGKSYANLSNQEKVALIDLMHQGGTHVLSKMPKLVEAINSGNTNDTYRQMDFGLKQTTSRANRRRDLYKTGAQKREADFIRSQTARYTTEPVDNTRVQMLMTSIPVTIPQNVPTTLSRYSGTPAYNPSFAERQAQRTRNNDLLNVDWELTTPVQFVPSFQPNIQLEQPWTAQ